MIYYGHLLERWSLEMDLVRDLELFMEKEMKRVGINPSNTRDISYEYFNTLKRMISIRPRNVVYSKEFQYPKEYKEALLEFEDNAQKGKNLNKYQSDKITRPEESDDLLNDWNIFHFHLSKRFRNDGFVKRSDYQIFAWITDNCIYMIQVYPHKEDFLYCKQELLEIIERNWPKLLEPYRLKDIVKLNEQFDDEQYEKIREAHITTLVQTKNNKVYGLLGGGYMSDGSSGEAIRNEYFWNNRLKICEDIIRRNMTSIMNVIREQRNNEGYAYNIKLLGIPKSIDKIKLIETKTQMGIELLLSESRFRIFKMEDEMKYVYEVFLKGKKQMKENTQFFCRVASGNRK